MTGCLLEQASANWNMYHKEMACKGGARERGHFLERGKAAVWKKPRALNGIITVTYSNLQFREHYAQGN